VAGAAALLSRAVAETTVVSAPQGVALDQRAADHTSVRRAVLAAAMVVSMLAATVPALADSRQELAAAQHRAARVQRKVDRQTAVVVAVREQMSRLAARIEVAIDRVDDAAAEARVARTDLQRERAHLQVLRDRLNARVADAFMFGFPGEVSYLLDSSSIQDMGDRLLFLDGVTAQDAKLVAAVTAQVEKVAAIEARLAAVLDRRRAALESLAADRAELDRLLDRQNTRLKKLAKYHAIIQRKVGQLAAEVRSELLALGGDGILGPLYRCPVDGPTAYGDTFGEMRNDPGFKHRHQGNDMMAALGTPVVAPFDGYATHGAQATAGIYVKVEGAEGFAYMMHLMRLGKLGAVETGDVVGYVGATGNATAPHVHFEWHPNDGAAVDPYPQLNEVC
jgi:murein DD-endopeptidase MepM/ murein hydrolase activator NlpD